MNFSSIIVRGMNMIKVKLLFYLDDFLFGLLRYYWSLFQKLFSISNITALIKVGSRS